MSEMSDVGDVGCRRCRMSEMSDALMVFARATATRLLAH